MKHISYDLIKWPVSLAVCTGLLVLAFIVHAEVRGEREEEESDRVRKEKRRDDPGQITLNNEKADYKLVPARQVKGWTEPLTVYGQIVPNEQATYEVRAGFPGTLRKGTTDWPLLGQRLRGGQTVGWLEVRVDPLVRLEIQNKLNDAQHQKAGAVEIRQVLEERVKRFKGASQSLPPRELEDTRIQLREARTKEAAADTAIKLWTQSLAETDPSSLPKTGSWIRRLEAPADGEVTELQAQPGMVMEAGSVLARLVDFRRLMVRLDFPSEALRKGPPQTVNVQAAGIPPAALRGARNQPQPSPSLPKVRATLRRQASQVGLTSQLTSYLYEIDAAQARITWRPGLFVHAELREAPHPDFPPREAIAVPAAALLYHQGRTLIYVRLKKDQDKKTTTFARREVEVLGREGPNGILAANPKRNLVAGVKVVASDPQELLAEEFITDEDND